MKAASGCRGIYYLEALQGKAVDLLNAGQWSEAAEVLNRAFVYPRNLNFGRQFVHPSEAMPHYMLGLIAEHEGRRQEAREHWLAAVAEMQHEGEPAQAFTMLAWLALGNWPKAMEVAHKFERIGRGEAKANEFTLWANGKSSPQLGVGFAWLVKGRADDARAVWAKVVEEDDKGARWIRPVLRMSDALLSLISRGNGFFLEQVRQDVARHVERFTGPKTCHGGGNGECDHNCGSNGDDGVQSPKKVRG